MNDSEVKVKSSDRRVWNIHVLLIVGGATMYIKMSELPTTTTKCCVTAIEDRWFRLCGMSKV